ncbi:hypothetical protein MA9V2_255 [Chryseobacterium phage MA9V-2]|nr:hypothetical protein MA9V2_255 [Chryseobacterium phage MA9V-2]
MNTFTESLDKFRLNNEDLQNLIWALNKRYNAEPSVNNPKQMTIAEVGMLYGNSPFTSNYRRMSELLIKDAKIVGDSPHFFYKLEDSREFFTTHLTSKLSHRSCKTNATVVDNDYLEDVYFIELKRLYTALFVKSFIHGHLEVDLDGFKELYIALHLHLDDFKKYDESRNNSNSAYMARYIMNAFYGVICGKANAKVFQISGHTQPIFYDFYKKLNEIVPTEKLIVFSTDDLILPQTDESLEILKKLLPICEDYGVSMNATKLRHYKVERNILRRQLDMKVHRPNKNTR